MFSRLLWKETRELVALWVGLFAIGVLLLGLAARIELPPNLYGQVALVLAGCFGLAAAARQFAGEEEDGTIGWLRMLPCDGRSVWWAKLLTAHAGAMLLWLPLAVLAVATAEGLPPTSTFAVYSPYALPTFLATTTAIATAVALWSRGVLATVLGTGAISVALAWVSGFLPDWMLNGPYQILVAAIALGVGWREFGGWWRGTVAEALVVEAALRPASTGRIGPIARPLARWSERTATRRMWRSLLWQEGRRAATFVGLWLVIVLTTMVILKWVAAELRPAFWLIPTTPLLAGLWSLRGDQRAGAYAFLGDRGISAAAVWLSRQVVWLPTAILLAGMAIWLDSQATAWFNGRNLTNIRVETWWNVWTQAGFAGGWRIPVSVDRIVFEQLLLFLSLYAVGHLASLIFPQVVLAIVAGALGGMAAIGWQWWRFSDFFTPVAWGACLPLVSLALAAALVGPWLEQKPLALRKGVTAGLLAVAMIVFSYGVTLSGLWSLPASTDQTTRRDLDAARQRLLAPNTQATVKLQAAIRQLSVPGRENAERWDDEVVATTEKWLAGKQSPQLDYRLTDGNRGVDGLGVVSPEVIALMETAARRAGPRSAAEFLMAIQRLFRLSRDNASTLIGWQYEVMATRNLVDSWMTWAERDDVTAEALARAIVDLEQEFRLGLTFGQHSANRTAALQLLTDRPAEHLDIVGGVVRLFGINDRYQPSRLDRWRIHRALTAMYATVRPVNEAVDFVVEDPTRSVAGTFEDRFGLEPGRRVEVSLEQMRVEFELTRQSYWLGHVTGWELQEAPWFRRNYAFRRNIERMLLVALTLEHHRKQTGKLPESLLGLQLPASGSIAARPVPVDLFGGGAFGYAPQGFDTPVLVDRSIHAAGQPLLWSPGLRRKSWHEVPESGGLKVLGTESPQSNRPPSLKELRHLPKTESVLPVFETEP